MRYLLFLFALLITAPLHAQDDIAYQTPPKLISDLVLAPPTPSISLSKKGDWLLLLQRSSYPSVEELAQPELKIAGLRINPANFAPSRQTFINSLVLRQVNSGKDFTITGLPSPLFASQVSWSPDEKKIALLHTSASRVDLYVIDVATRRASKVNKTPLNSIMVDYDWIDNQRLLYAVTTKTAAQAPKRSLLPKGPATQENLGKASPRPTYQDMIKSPHDEDLFAFYTTVQLIQNTNGAEQKIGQPAIYSRVSISPDKKYMLTQTIKKPFSYLVPASGFATAVSITDIAGKLIKKITDLPSAETAPSGYDNVQPTPRGYGWRNDQPASLTWCEPLDSGLIKKPAEYRDAVYQLEAPFSGKPEQLFRTKMRFSYVLWGNDQAALVSEGLRSKQQTQLNRYSPTTGDLEKLFSRNTTDAYSNPGQPVTAPNQWDKQTLLLLDKGNKILLNNTTGSSPKGDLPFLLSFDLHTKKADTLWRCHEGSYEYVAQVSDPEKLVLITRRETENEVPNYWQKNLRLRIADRPLTAFKDPYPAMKGVQKQKIKYQRADGVTLTGDLYTPAGYTPGKDAPLPVFIWAYPAEYNSVADAAQIRGSKHRFTTLSWGSPVFYVTQGYAVLNNAEMPIVATDTARKPNDNFIEQLRLNAEAAIRKLSDMKVGDSNRVAVGGHSYGAFMTANLLAHTKLFKAGIARSGAYNRTLTPFGFQNEDRTYWQAPELYHDMSPFSYANQIKTPLLLIHGDADNNTGTYPIQSERLFNAIKGHGGVVRYISLPYESHGYQGKENILHLLTEQLNWLDKYVKNAR